MYASITFLGTLPDESAAVLTHFPSEYAARLIERGEHTWDADDDTVRATLARLGFEDTATGYARRVVESHRSMRYERQTGHPF